MPALDAHRIFLSTVTAEFARYRSELAARFERVSVKAVFQEEFEYHDTDLVEKLYQLILPSDVVIHFVGAAAGAMANPKAVEDFLQHCQQRGKDFLGFWKTEHGLERAFFDQLTYTQWEAVIAVFLNKSFMPLQPSGHATDGHPPDRAPFAPAAADATSQQRHLDWLTKTIRRYPQDLTETDGSYLEDAFDKITGFLLRENAQWRQTAQQLQALPKPERKTAPSRILRHAPERLFGRDKEMAALDAAWAAKDSIHIYTLVAWGGTGKTSLVAHWVKERFVETGWQDVERYFDWSFYSQGTGESRQNSSDLFISEALAFFGDPDSTLGSPWERGQRLADLVRQHRTLLVLDGIESLQYPPTDRSGQAGMLKDQGLESLLQGLAMDFPGLCLVTTRETLANLRTYHSSTAPEEKLDTLLREAAIALLRHLQITGTEQEMEAAWRDAGGHALTLQLLGRFIADAFPDRDIRHYRQLRFEEADLERQGRSAFKVMLAYESWLQTGDPERQRELALLRLTGLFDRPISSACLAALRAPPPIPGLTDALVSLTVHQWQAALTRLQSIDLISLSTATGATTPDSLDAHPLIREYFAVQLREQQPEAFRQAHSRLFEHLCEAAPENTRVLSSLLRWRRSRLGKVCSVFGLLFRMVWVRQLRRRFASLLKGAESPTLEDLQPLYQAVVHGCLAGRQQEACEKVYRDRILRGTGSFGFYSTKKLGAIGADLGAVAAFFDQPWSLLSAKLSAADQAWLLNEAASRLRALGRLTEAREPMRASGRMDVTAHQWKGAAICFSNLSELEVTLGLVEEAVASARRAVEFADKSGDAFQRMLNRTTAADALHQSGAPGGRSEARGLFEQAETLQRERQSQVALLCSVAGFRYGDLILASAERAAWRERSADTPVRTMETSGGDAVKLDEADESVRAPFEALADAERRATQTLDWVTPQNWLLDIALDHLTLARVALYRALLETAPDFAYQNPHLHEALDGLRKAGMLDYLPRALLTAALHHHFLGDPDTARRFLDEAKQIAERGPMPLHLADVHLHRARLFRDKAELAKARALIEKHSYGRRREELADAEAAAGLW